jgi:large conductance mechanosensitive channel
MKGWINEFKAFILRGNVVDLAVAVVIGVAFGAVVTSLVQNVIMPIIGAFGGKPSFDQYWWTINGSQIKIGTFLTALVAFVILAAVIFFFVVKPVNWLMSRRKTELPLDPTTHDCP